jgi:hypothetical protein
VLRISIGKVQTATCKRQDANRAITGQQPAKSRRR